MVSQWFGREKPSEYYQPEYHGKIFTRSEILAIIEAYGFPEEETGKYTFLTILAHTLKRRYGTMRRF
jgi:hypothetical protein